MAKKSYNRRSYRRRKTNKKNKPTKLKSKKKSYKKGGMFNLHQLAASASTAPPVAYDDKTVDCDDIRGMNLLFEMVATRDVRTANVTVRAFLPPADVAAFDASLKRGDILELNNDKGVVGVRWFGVVMGRAPASREGGGVFVRWFKEIKMFDEDETFSLELDELQPNCDFYPFNEIIGTVKFI
jgi:hypothetical protein